MFQDEKKSQFSELLSNLWGKLVTVSAIQLQGGGCINKAAILTTSEGKVFVKWNYSTLAPMFEAEEKGLQLLRSAGEVIIPKVLGRVTSEDETFLFLEMISPNEIKKDFYEDFGKRLANIHKHSAPQFGLDHDNYIGSLVQINTLTDNWNDFFYEHRLLVQLMLAFDAQKLDKSILIHFENLHQRLNEIFPKEPSSLLHGDLWGGNILKGQDGSVCLIDPAVYYGHREMELAYTKMFDDHPDSFYSAYHNEFPIKKGFEDRADIYNLYPLLVHVNLFGGGYVNQVKEIISLF